VHLSLRRWLLQCRGQGQLLASILHAYPALHGVLFDLPYVVAGALPLLEDSEVASRCEVLGGDAFTAVPAGYETSLGICVQRVAACYGRECRH
jgi:O-methyltransferase domain